MAYYPQIESLYYSSSGQKGGDYAYLDLDALISNFMAVYVGQDKVIKRAARTDVVFHARRALAELSFDTLHSKNAISMHLDERMRMKLPNDYVNYVKLSWIDNAGVEHTIMPTRVSRNPRDPDQDGGLEHGFDDSSGSPTLGPDGSIDDMGRDSTQLQNYKSSGNHIANSLDWNYDDDIYQHNIGRRYGLEPEFGNINGTFFIDHRTGYIFFSSDLSGKEVSLQYISDGLGSEGSFIITQDGRKTYAWSSNPIVPKMAEEALYKHIAYAIVSSGLGYTEPVIARLKKERFAETRKTKIRLSNFKFEEITQVLRGKSKWIKH